MKWEVMAMIGTFEHYHMRGMHTTFCVPGKPLVG
jgi:hypothetical protein